MKRILLSVLATLSLGTQLTAAEEWVCFPDTPPTESPDVIVLQDLIVYLKNEGDNSYFLTLTQGNATIHEDQACIPNTEMGIATTMFLQCGSELVSFDSANNRGTIKHVEELQSPQYAQQDMLCRNMSLLINN